MEQFTLPLFPEGSLDSSVVTTVWIGVLVCTFFNMRFGWTFSGLVVPGYLVPLMLAKPWSAVAIVIVAIAAYLQFYFVSEVLSKWGVWDNFFGRDRFFGLLLSGVIARLAFDAVIFPVVGDYLDSSFGIEFDYRNNLQSFGLIVVTLLANQFWKPGLRKGFIHFSIILGISYVLVRFVLLEYTNFSIANLQFMYEGISESLVASPKAYIILLTAAFIASKFNLFYGWDFNGILLPSLLALQLYDPSKIFTSFVEAIVVYSLASLILQAPLFKHSSIEGAKKLAFFFNVSFFYKLILGYFIVTYFPSYQVSDYFGFGYLLPTLMAVKMHDKKILVRFTVTTLSTAIFAALMGNLVGFGITLLPSFGGTSAPYYFSQQPLPPLVSRTEPLSEIIQEEQIRLYSSQYPNFYQSPLPYEQSAFREGINLLIRYSNSQSESELQSARRWLRAVNYQVDIVDDKFLFIHEKQIENGWGFYVLDTSKQNGLLVEVPAPLDEWRTLSAGRIMFERLNARALASAGAPLAINSNMASDVLARPGSIFHVFHETLSENNVLQVRGYTPKSIRDLAGINRTTGELQLPDMESKLWILSQIPQGLNLAQLNSLIDDMEIEWGEGPYQNVQRDMMWSGFAELWLSHQDRRSMLTRVLEDYTVVERKNHVPRIDGYLYEWLINTKGEIAESGSNAYVPPTEEEMLFFDQEILSPLYHMISNEWSNGDFTEQGLMELSLISAAASNVGYQVLWYYHVSTDQNYLILSESGEQNSRNYRGTYVFRLGNYNPYIIHLPRPLFERNTFEFGVELFEQLQAQALLISGAHKNTNFDGSADILRLSNKKNFFNLTNQVILREAKDNPQFVVSCRAFGIRQDAPTSNASMLLSFADGTTKQRSFSYLGMELLNEIEEKQFDYQFVDGSLETAGYEASSFVQARYLRQTENKEFLAIWLSPFMRKAYRIYSEIEQQESHFVSLNIPTVRQDVFQIVSSKTTTSQSPSIADDLFEDVNRYLRSDNIIALKYLIDRYPSTRFTRAVDIDSLQAFLLIETPSNVSPIIVNLTPRPDHVESIYEMEAINRESWNDFIISRFAWLEW